VRKNANLGDRTREVSGKIKEELRKRKKIEGRRRKDEDFQKYICNIYKE